MQPYQHQIDHINSIIEQVSQKRRVLAQLPTGGGKTVEFILIADRYIKKTGKSVLILVHREELMNQAAKTAKAILGINACIIDSSTKKYRVSELYIGMVESVVRRLDFMFNVGLVIIDECHVANFNKMHHIFLEELIIGFTATNIAASKKHPLNEFYQSIVVGPSIKELISKGYLAQNITRCPKNIIDVTKLEIDKLKGEFNESKMATEYRKSKHVANVAAVINKYCKGQKTIVFNVTIDHSKEVNKLLQFFGFNSRHLDSDSSKRPSQRFGFKNEREEILDWFKHNDDAILNNVMIGTVGFDEPSIRNVVLNFSTLSLVKFIQTCGRGGRKFEGKDYFNIIDLGGNCIRFGDWSDDRDWKYIFNNPHKPTEGIAPVKTCPKCDGLIHASLMKCPLFDENGDPCGYEFKKKEQPKEKELGEMVLITKGINVDELIEKNKNKYDYYVFFKMAEPILDNLYENFEEPTENQIQKAFISYYELCKNWWKEKMAGIDGNRSNIDDSAWHIKRARYNFDNYLSLKKAARERQLQTELK